MRGPAPPLLLHLVGRREEGNTPPFPFFPFFLLHPLFTPGPSGRKAAFALGISVTVGNPGSPCLKVSKVLHSLSRWCREEVQGLLMPNTRSCCSLVERCRRRQEAGIFFFPFRKVLLIKHTGTNICQAHAYTINMNEKHNMAYSSRYLALGLSLPHRSTPPAPGVCALYVSGIPGYSAIKKKSD